MPPHDHVGRGILGAIRRMVDTYDRMPGLQKRLARCAQLFSHVGFVQQFHRLSGRELQTVVERQWVQLGLESMTSSGPDAELLNTVTRVAGGNFRLIQRLFAQIERPLTINNIATVTTEVLDARSKEPGRQRAVTRHSASITVALTA